MKLCDHLGIENGQDFIFAGECHIHSWKQSDFNFYRVLIKITFSLLFCLYEDPENDSYDRLNLNRGWDTMMRPATAFRFRDRIFGQSGSLDQVRVVPYIIQECTSP